MYYRHFGLNGSPFQFTSSPRQLYLSKAHREGLAALEWGLLHEPSGFTRLVGETGTGKTTLVCSLLARQYEQVRTVYVSNPKLSFEEITQLISGQLGLAPERPGRLAFLQAFNQFLAQLKPGERVAIILDEAQGLSDETLEELRLLSNCGRTDEKQLQFVLVGQPELLQRLSAPSLRQLDQRVGARAVLNAMQREEVYGYIEHRLNAHNGRSRRIFARPALRYLAEHSAGVPRRVNVLCHNAMLLAYSAGASKVSLAMAYAAVAEYENLLGAAKPFSAPQKAQRPGAKLSWYIGGRGVSLAVLGLIAATAAYLWSPWITYRQELRPVSGEHTSLAALRRAVALVEGSHPENAATSSGAAKSADSPAPAKRAADPPGAGNGSYTDARVKDDAAAPRNVVAAPSEAGRASQRRRSRVLVRHGDTLKKIAGRYLGSEEAVDRLTDVNPQISDVNHIYPGEIVYLPADAGSVQRE
jgi:type II secretory pathway predicted ATPase ExeA